MNKKQQNKRHLHEMQSHVYDGPEYAGLDATNSYTNMRTLNQHIPFYPSHAGIVKRF